MRPWRVLFYTVGILVFATMCFQMEDAVSKGGDSAPAVSENPIQPTLSDALSVSAHQFFPVDIPLGSEWEPSGGYTVVATLLIVWGWIIVPFGVAQLSGFLRGVR